MNYDQKVTGWVVARIRVQCQMSQEMLAGLSGITRSHLTLIENGKKSPKIETLWQIAEVFDMRLSELLAMIEKEIAIFKIS